jgi:hypothetical protein
LLPRQWRCLALVLACMAPAHREIRDLSGTAAPWAPKHTHRFASTWHISKNAHRLFFCVVVRSLCFLLLCFFSFSGFRLSKGRTALELASDTEALAASCRPTEEASGLLGQSLGRSSACNGNGAGPSLEGSRGESGDVVRWEQVFASLRDSSAEAPALEMVNAFVRQVDTASSSLSLSFSLSLSLSQ